MLAPILSELDPVVSSEGSIDPLGLYPIADDLAIKLIPGIRERQSHPRFLTVMVVSLAVCQDFDEETVAKDGTSEPWLVFEWYVVDGLVRTAVESDEVRGLRGRPSATRCLCQPSAT